MSRFFRSQWSRQNYNCPNDLLFSASYFRRTKSSWINVNKQCREIKSIVGVAPQKDNLDPDFTVLKNLTVYSLYFDIPKEEALKRATEQLKFFQLEEFQ